MALNNPRAESLPDPDTEEGIKYWEAQSANYDGVLGGYGNGSLPRVDALGSRHFLMYLLPELCTVPSAVRPLHVPEALAGRRTRALDVGAGVGRVTADVLLYLFSDVVLVEPVDSFVNEAFRRGKASEVTSSADGAPTADAEGHELEVVPWKGIHDQTKSVTFIQGTLQDLDPSNPVAPASDSETSAKTKVLGRAGYFPLKGTLGDLDEKFDVIWCQWCLGTLSDTDLVDFFHRSKAALRDPARSLIVVKENLCSEEGAPRTVFDKDDSSLTRSDLAWKKNFADAGLKVIYEQVQRGLPKELYRVKMYALR